MPIKMTTFPPESDILSIYSPNPANQRFSFSFDFIIPKPLDKRI